MAVLSSKPFKFQPLVYDISFLGVLSSSSPSLETSSLSLTTSLTLLNPPPS